MPCERLLYSEYSWQARSTARRLVPRAQLALHESVCQPLAIYGAPTVCLPCAKYSAMVNHIHIPQLLCTALLILSLKYLSRLSQPSEKMGQMSTRTLSPSSHQASLLPMPPKKPLPTWNLHWLSTARNSKSKLLAETFGALVSQPWLCLQLHLLAFPPQLLVLVILTYVPSPSMSDPPWFFICT